MHGRMGRKVVKLVAVDVRVTVGECDVVVVAVVDVVVVVVSVRLVEVNVTVGEYTVVPIPVVAVVGTVTVGDKIVEIAVDVVVVDVVSENHDIDRAVAVV